MNASEVLFLCGLHPNMAHDSVCHKTKYTNSNLYARLPNRLPRWEVEAIDVV